MSFIEYTSVDLESLVRVLTRIADALDRAYPPPPPDAPISAPSKITDADLIIGHEETLWEKEQERLRSEGLLDEESNLDFGP